MEHCQRWISWQLIGKKSPWYETGDKNEKSHLYQRISIDLQRGNAASQSNCMTLSWWPCHKIVSFTFTCVQCCFCKEDDPLEWPLTTIAIFSCATIFNACGSPWAQKIMNFYSPVSTIRCHSIGHKMRIARIKIRVDSPERWERA